MWNELNEVPDLLRQGLCCSNKIIANNIKPFNINEVSHIKLIASGSSNNVAHSARFALEVLLHKPISVEYASEFAHRHFYLDEKTLVIPISQSGKTADTLAAIKKIRDKTNCQILSITNVKDSPIYKLSDYNILIGAGTEKAVPATKTFSMQLLALISFAFCVTNKDLINPQYLKEVEEDLINIPDIITEIIKLQDQFKTLASKLIKTNHLIILGRGINYPIAREGALKFKETCYIDANGYPAGEFMHGYMAMLDKKTTVLSLVHPKDELLKANITKLMANSNSSFFGISMDPKIKDYFKESIIIPKTQTKLVSAFAFTTCIQLLSFFASQHLGFNPDKPRGLTKYLKKETS